MYGHKFFLARLTVWWRWVGFSLLRQGFRSGRPRSWGRRPGVLGQHSFRGRSGRAGRKGAGWLWVVLFLGLAFLSVWSIQQMDQKLSPVISRLAVIQGKQIAVETINQVIRDKIAENPDYQNLMVIHKDKDNRPVLIQPDTMKIQKMQATAMVEVNRALEQISGKEFSIPLGLLLNTSLLANTGPDIHVSFRPTGVVDMEVINEFQQAGINQTRQIISLKINTEMAVVAPLMRDTTKITTVVKVADNIIIGQTPSVLFNK